MKQAVYEIQHFWFKRNDNLVPIKTTTMLLFEILWTIDAVASLTILYFFLMGLANGSISLRNMAILPLLTILLIAVLACCIWLQNHNQQHLSFTLLAAITASAMFYGIYTVVSLFANRKMNA